MPLSISAKQLIEEHLIESERIELKEGFNPESILHTMCAFANDFNTPDVLAILFSTIRSYNSLCGNEQTAQLSGHAKAASSLIKLIEEDVGGILGVGLLDPKSALLALSQFKAKLSGNSTSRPNPDEIEALIVKRLEARKSKDFHTSDAIRDDLLKKGVLLKDGPKGTTWEYQ